MRDYKLRKKVFNEYPTTAEVQKMIAQGGGGSSETREPMFSFDVVAETPYLMSGIDSLDFMAYSLNIEVHVDNTLFYLSDSDITDNILTMHYYSDNDDEMIFTVDVSGTARRVTVTSPISGTFSTYMEFGKPIAIQGVYDNDEITIQQPAEIILSNILYNYEAVAILYIGRKNAQAKGYLTVSQFPNGSTMITNISCDIDISGKFTFSVDNGYIKGVHESA